MLKWSVGIIAVIAVAVGAYCWLSRYHSEAPEFNDQTEPTRSRNITHTRDLIEYDFTAQSFDDLRKNMLDASPIKKNNRTFTGYTWSNWNWSIEWDEADTSCVVTGVTMTMDTTVTLPKWTNPETAPDPVQEEWARYMAALTGHEEGHVDINSDTVSAITTGLGALAPETDCDLLSQSAQALSDAEGAKNKAAHLDYDATTGHGRTQGARLRDGL